MKRVLWIVALAICSSVWANGQTIADVARQEREKRKDAPKTSTTNTRIVRYGNKTAIVSTPPPTPEPNVPAPSPAPGAPAAPSPAVTAAATPVATVTPPAPTEAP